MLQLVRNMEAVERDCCISGYHTYKETWDAAAGEDLKCQRKSSNLRTATQLMFQVTGQLLDAFVEGFPCALCLYEGVDRF